MKASNFEIKIVENLAALSREAANLLLRRITELSSQKAYLSIALSGGTTPKMLHSLLVDQHSLKSQIPWNKIHFFWGDERHVPPQHADSNYRMAKETIFDKADKLPKENIHRVRAENPEANQVALEYEKHLLKFFNPAAGQLPVLDFAILGMGPDGHTASLFPGTTALQEQNRLIVANWVDKFESYRITMTVPLINNADMIIFLVSGNEKAETLKMVLEGSRQPDLLPSQLIRPKRGRLLWLVDRAAASRLTEL
jgi:6-phosphogluconolactonase